MVLDLHLTMSSQISECIVDWQLKYGRHDLPWQQDINPYRVWVSEVMLQQTQVSTVIPYYKSFMHQFPSVDKLARSDEDTVFRFWSGLGYYRRAKYLHKASIAIMDEYDGKMPCSADELEALPGIGKSTAHAIMSIAHNQPFAILDGNVKRVLSRAFCIESPIDSPATIKSLWAIANKQMHQKSCRIYTQGIMDLGAQICVKKPLCDMCPIQQCCLAFKNNKQAHLPTKKKSKKKPERETFCVCYIFNNKLFMQQRSDQGIWPKLWTPIMTESLDDTICGEKLYLKSFKHVFTHFSLTIKPVVVLSEPRGLLGSWFDKDSALSAAIPAAISKLILNGNIFEYSR